MRHSTITKLLFLTLLLAWTSRFCTKAARPAGEESPFLNVRGSVAYVGMAMCRSCHDNVHQTFSHTGMGRSFDLATREKSAARFGNHALVFDTLKNFYYYPYFSKKDSAMYVLEFRLEGGDTVHQRLEKIDYIIGSGQHTNSHLMSVNGYLYQAPLTWYVQEGKWDLAPGFRADNPRFGRALTSDCVTCHNHYPALQEGSLHKFLDMPQGIECERCHGPGKLHVEEKLAGNITDTSRYADYTIVNPRRLPRDLRMDLCQRCHLQGVAVAEEGKTFFDFKPGMKLNSVMNVFLPRFTDTHEKFIMASQADRLRMSECYKNSPEMSCLTCHHPHHSVEETSQGQFNKACMNCHGQICGDVAANSTLSAVNSKGSRDNCIACHMPRSGSIDIPHVRITDHLISRKKEKTVRPQQKAFLGIQILTKDHPTPLDMARGYLATYEKYVAAPIMLDSAAWYLARSEEPLAKKFPILVNLLFWQNDHEGILQNLAKMPAKTSQDAWTNYRIGEAFYKTGGYVQAHRYFQKAAEQMPYHLDFLEKNGLALVALRRLPEAKTCFEKVLAENPKRPVALCNLGYVVAVSGEVAKAEALYNQAIALDPDYEQALVNKAALLIFLKKAGEAKRLLGKVLKKNPGNEQARKALENISPL